MLSLSRPRTVSKHQRLRHPPPLSIHIFELLPSNFQNTPDDHDDEIEDVDSCAHFITPITADDGSLDGPLLPAGIIVTEADIADSKAQADARSRHRVRNLLARKWEKLVERKNRACHCSEESDLSNPMTKYVFDEELGRGENDDGEDDVDKSNSVENGHHPSYYSLPTSQAPIPTITISSPDVTEAEVEARRRGSHMPTGSHFQSRCPGDQDLRQSPSWNGHSWCEPSPELFTVEEDPD